MEEWNFFELCAFWLFKMFIYIGLFGLFVYAPIKLVYYIVQAFRGKAKIGSWSDINYTDSEKYFGGGGGHHIG